MVVMEHKVKCLDNDGLQGQHLSAQGNTLGNSNRQICNTPCKGKSLMNLIVKPNEHSQACLSYAMARTDGTASAVTCYTVLAES